MSDQDNDKGPRNTNPWGHNTGGPGSRPPRNPWGRPEDRQSGPSAQGGTDSLDDLFKDMSRHLNGLFGGGGGSGHGGHNGAAPGGQHTGKIVALGLIVLLALWLLSGLFIVSPGEQAVVQRFGAWERTVSQEGLSYHLPVPIENVTKVNVTQIRRTAIGFAGRESVRAGANDKLDRPEESLMLTSDRNIVDIDLVIQWNIASAEDYLFNIEDPDATLKKIAESAIREAVGQTRLFPIITTGREAVADETQAITQALLDEYDAGINVTQVLIQSAEVHPDVQGAFQDVQSAKQDAEDVQNQAQAYREDIIPKARGAAIQTVQQAEAYQQSVIARATGDAERFNNIYSAYKTGEDVTKERLYIETMEDVLRNAKKVILDQDGGTGVVPYLPLDRLGGGNRAAGGTGNSSSGQ